MKECCVLLAPQREIADIAEEECRKRKWPCRVIYCVNNSVAVEFAKKYKENGIKVFISRGGMAKAIEREAGVTAVPIEISFQDIAEAVTLAKSLGKKVGISINTVLEYDLNRIREMLSIDVDVIRIPPNGLLIDAIQKAKADGFDVIAGGVAPVYFAQQEGMKTVSLQSGRDSVFTAIEKAVVRARGSYGLEMFQSLQEGIIILDQANEVFYVNDSACRMMAADQAAILNKRLEDVLPMLSSAGKTKDDTYGIYTAFTFKKKCFLQTYSSVCLDNTFEGKMIQIYDSDVIEMLHSRMRTYSPEGKKTAKYMFSDIVTRNDGMKKLIRHAVLYAKTNSTILITGETGTGKELFAQSIHNASYRRDQPFIAVNCSAIPESILESELFGYEPGAFTGALRSGKKGLFEAAEGGTIFLDEIGELPAQLQAKLLRVLQEKEIMRVGSSEAIPVHVRVIAATLANLEEKMERGTFRRDLYYRLNILNLHIPPLRERADDIPC
ncbi:sigma 54-interacting transcriptional regulator [Clostridium sp. AM58-1XD]|uniref:sigma 54-interacting transcriptional regulator n=1 Tax=Clostridium sp. AM58-1XD TaxID=2292307 RepID=UPI000E46D629|nr:sigma 54-interacting transcriptional regulator [Clostridium sp. AM58-1XD]RGY99867.1 PAS domain-containing protein [Clostridium sp. AM58-1XD]